MLKGKLNTIKEFLLQKNKYFGSGFELEFNKPEVDIFLEDNRGNYFYLRLPNNVSFVQGGEWAVQECQPGLAASAAVVLVAFVRDADEDVLITNLINTLQAVGGTIQFTGATYRKETVVSNELSGQPAETVQYALANIPKEASIVSVNFNIVVPVVFNNCIYNPCKQC